LISHYKQLMMAPVKKGQNAWAIETKNRP